MAYTPPPLNRAQFDMLRQVAQLGIGNASTLGAQRVSHRRLLHSLAARGLLNAITVQTAARGDTHYRISAAGRRELLHAPRAHGAIVPSGTAPAPIRHPGTYDGAELRPYQGRPGAMDAFALPSLINGRRVGRGSIDAERGEKNGA